MEETSQLRRSANTHRSNLGTGEPHSPRHDEQSPLMDPQKTGHTWLRKPLKAVIRHLSFIGPGLIASVAYCDPGNWATDMEAGSRFGYRLLFTVLLSGLFAVLLQVLCCRLGTVTGLDLAVQTRRLVLGLPAFTSPAPDWNAPWMRARYWGLLIPLYVINEGAIIATELAELVGSAIALNLLFPNLPLWGGVLVTSADVFLILFLYRPSMSVRIFETLIGVLVLIVLACFIVLLVRVDPNWGDVFYGYIPSHTVIEAGGLYVSISILGATIMPHSLVLGSHFATIDRLEGFEEVTSSASSEADGDELESACDESLSRTETASLSQVKSNKTNERTSPLWRTMRTFYRRILSSHLKVPEVVQDDSLPPRNPTTLEHVQLHLNHASWDIAICLVLFAITINSAILIVASAAFYYGNNSSGDKEVVADLFQAFRLLRANVGKAPAILFAIALLTAGQSSSITVTLAGQIISEGFLHWRVTPFVRRLLTRLIAVVPSMIVAALAGREGLDKMLVASQVALSMALPFVSFPLIVLTGSRMRMQREIIKEVQDTTSSEPTNYGTVDSLVYDTPEMPIQRTKSPMSYLSPTPFDWIKKTFHFLFCVSNTDDSPGPTYFHAFNNNLVSGVLAWAVFLLICIADVYVLYATLKDPSNA